MLSHFSEHKVNFMEKIKNLLGTSKSRKRDMGLGSKIFSGNSGEIVRLTHIRIFLLENIAPEAKEITCLFSVHILKSTMFCSSGT